MLKRITLRFEHYSFITSTTIYLYTSTRLPHTITAQTYGMETIPSRLPAYHQCTMLPHEVLTIKTPAHNQSTRLRMVTIPTRLSHEKGSVLPLFLVKSAFDTNIYYHTLYYSRMKVIIFCKSILIVTYIMG